jgi:hypothetical protein
MRTKRHLPAQGALLSLPILRIGEEYADRRDPAKANAQMNRGEMERLIAVK